MKMRAFERRALQIKAQKRALKLRIIERSVLKLRVGENRFSKVSAGKVDFPKVREFEECASQVASRKLCTRSR